MAKIEDILFWVLIALIVGIAIWKLFGSPTDTATLISIALFVAGSEILLWRALFNIDKNTAIGFVKVKNNVDNIKREIDINQRETNNNFKELKELVTRKKK